MSHGSFAGVCCAGDLQYYGFVEADNPNDVFVIKRFDSLLAQCAPSGGAGGTAESVWKKANILEKLAEVS